MTPNQLVDEFNSSHKKYKFPVILLDFVFQIYTKCMQLCEQIDASHKAIDITCYLPDYLAEIERVDAYNHKTTNLSKRLPCLELKQGTWSLKLKKPFLDNIQYHGAIFYSLDCETIEQGLQLGEILKKGYERKHLRKNRKGFINIDVNLQSIDYVRWVYPQYVHSHRYILHPGDFL